MSVLTQNGAVCVRDVHGFRRIELCDILTADGEFIHVKRKSRSSTLSHLFAQGSISAETFVNDGVFRDKIRDEIKGRQTGALVGPHLGLIPERDVAVDRSRYTVHYAVLTTSKRDGVDWIPFFSKLNLMQHGRQLSNLGFRMSISKVSVV